MGYAPVELAWVSVPAPGKNAVAGTCSPGARSLGRFSCWMPARDPGIGLRYTVAVMLPWLQRGGRFVRFGLDALVGRTLTGVGLILTRRCNLDCPYCGVIERGSEARRRELTSSEWCRVVDRFVSHGHRHFILTGGEPLLYDGLVEVLEHTAQRGLTSLITNATLLDDEALRRLRRLDFLTFSWDTLGANGGGLVKDPSARVASIAQGCRRHAILPSAIVTVTARNLDEVVPIVLRLDREGVPALLSVLHSGGKGFDFRGDSPLHAFHTEQDCARLERLGERLIALKRSGVRVAESEAFLRGMAAFVRGTFQMRCPAANPFFTVDVDGRIKACHDAPPSSVSALTFDDYDSMRRAVRATAPRDCNCYYDCYFEARNRPWQTLSRATRRLGWRWR